MLNFLLNVELVSTNVEIVSTNVEMVSTNVEIVSTKNVDLEQVPLLEPPMKNPELNSFYKSNEVSNCTKLYVRTF